MSQRRADIASAAAAGLRSFASTITQTPVLIGFDGFVDSIIKVVEQRESPDSFDAIPTIDRFGARISAAAGHSANFELVTTLKKLGGNGPIMANAMANAGLPITYIGAVGHPDLHEVFKPFADLAEVHAIAEPGMTDALEFDDGKLMLGKYDHLLQLGVKELQNTVGLDAFRGWVERSRLVAMINWTMMPGTESIWEAMIERILPAVPAEVGGQRRLIFFDLCDPAKREDDDLCRAMKLLTRMNDHADVLLGLNLAEASHVAECLGVAIVGDPEAAIEATAAALREKLDLFGVVVHPRGGAAAAVKHDDGVKTATFAGPFVSKPRLSTGAGDNFNAGFCLGLLAGLPLDQCLATGTGTSGYYVREAHSPTLTQLAGFLDALPEPQGS